MSSVRAATTVATGRARRRRWAAAAIAALVMAGTAGGAPGSAARGVAQAQTTAAAGAGFDGDPATTERIGNGDPTSTAVAVSAARFAAAADAGDGATLPTAAHAVLSRPDDPADSLAATALTGDGPLLFAATGGLPADTTAELRRVLGDGGRVYLLGGTAAIGAPVADALGAEGHQVVRLEGATRIETALAVADEVRRRGDTDEVLLARAFGTPEVPSAGWADAVSAGAVAAGAGTPVLLTPGEGLPPSVAAWLQTDAPRRTVLLGSEVALSAAVADAVPAPQRVSGSERAGTAAAVARELSGAADQGARRVVGIDGYREDGWAFGLAAAGLAADAGAPLLLVGAEVAEPTRALVASCGEPVVDTLLVGDRTVIATTAERQVDALDGRTCTPLPDGTRTLSSDLVGFDDCEELLGHYRDTALRLVGPYGIESYGYGGGGMWAGGDMAEEASEAGGGAPAPVPAQRSAGDDASGTNVQEEGVDEPDTVKTDGEIALSIARGGLQVVDLTGAEPRLAATVDLGLDDPYGYQLASELLLQGDDVVVLTNVVTAIEPDDPGGQYREELGTRLVHVDVSDPDGPEVVDEVTLDGTYVSARMVDGVARVVLSTGPHGIAWAYPDGSATTEEEWRAGEAEATARNRELIERSTLANWLPTVDGEDLLLGCDDVSSPLEFSGLSTLTVATVPVGGDLVPDSAAAVVAGGDLVYASPESLYVATSRWSESPEGWNGPIGVQATAIHAFDIADPTATTYTASGRVSGFLLNQFALSEHDGVLRAATTEVRSCCDPETGAPDAESAVTLLRRDDRGFEEVGRVGGLGEGEVIQAVRFMGDLAAVVTFQQIDPLYLLDLGDPTAPAVLGELEVPGFSEYLHRVGEDLLVGVGQDATPDGIPTGAQASTFDISDRSAPRLVDTAALGGTQSYSPVGFDHRSFLYWEPSRLLALPVEDYGDGTGQSLALVGLRVAPDGALDEVGRVSHTEGDPNLDPGWYDGAVTRSFVAGSSLFSVSQRGLGEADLSTMAERSFTMFPPLPEQTEVPVPAGTEAPMPAATPVAQPDGT